MEYRQSWKLIVCAAQLLREYAVKGTKQKIEKLTMAQEKVIMVVFAHPEGIMLKDIAEELGLTPGAVSQTIDIMVREGMLERVVSPQDRRAVSIRPTKKSRDLLQKNFTTFNNIMMSAQGDMTDSEKKAFVATLERVIELAVAQNKPNHHSGSVRILDVEGL